MTDKELYKQAKKRVEAKRSVTIHFMTYVIIMVFLTAIYWVTDTGGYFWPIWPMMGWGVGVAIHAATVFASLKNFDSEVEKEFIKLKATSGDKFTSDDSHTDYTSRKN